MNYKTVKLSHAFSLPFEGDLKPLFYHYSKNKHIA